MLQVVSLGRIVQDSACYVVLTGKPILYPDHYTVHRAVFLSSGSPTKPALLYKDSAAAAAAVESMEKPYFTATVTVVAAAPSCSPTSSAGAGATSNGATLHFTLTRSDNPAEKVYRGTGTSTTVWREALDEAARDFPDRAAQLVAPYDAKGHLQVNGPRLFGLHLKEVQEALMALPGGAAAFEKAAAMQAAQRPQSTSPASRQPQRRASSISAAAAEKRAASPSPARASQGATAATGSKRSSRTTSVDKSATHATTTTTAAADDPPAKLKRQRKPKAAATAAPGLTTSTAVTAAQGTVAETSSRAAPPTKRRRTSAAKSGWEASAAHNAVAAPAVVVCPDCGLAGTPFCAATGKPHEVPRCPVCGLCTAFCPVSGQPHAGVVQRENRQRGEVHLPGTTRKPRRKTAVVKAGQQQQQQSSDVAEVTVVSTQDSNGSRVASEGGDQGESSASAKKPRRKRLRTASVRDGANGTEAGTAATTVAGAATTTTGAEGGAPTRSRRGRKAKKDEASATSAKDIPVASATTGAAAVASENEAPRVEEVKEAVYVYPPLRPPLSAREHHKAAQLMQQNWKAQYGEGPVLPPAVAAVPLAFVQAKRSVGTTARGRRKGRGDAAAAKAEEEENDEAEGRNGDPHNYHDEAKAASSGQEEKAVDGPVGGEAEEGEDDHHGHKSELSSSVGSPNGSSPPAALPSMVHPLEVTQLTSSAAGKRLTRFLTQYASERSQFDLLRSHAAAAAAAAASGGGNAERKKSTEGKEPPTREEGGGEAATEGGAAEQKTDVEKEDRESYA